MSRGMARCRNSTLKPQRQSCAAVTSSRSHSEHDSVTWRQRSADRKNHSQCPFPFIPHNLSTQSDLCLSIPHIKWGDVNV
jgi:hypothetical protein